ncbi:hypothetical protein [Desulfonatronum thioautotrophicum]|uniref:hypothetical protein n=1 Tax=Desulfonatronum thioautotrophicum TaxID=617001 RepID=UPI0012946636|nr:hypothetical protein [Desulfonatronum thioautotrophicum]
MKVVSSEWLFSAERAEFCRHWLITEHQQFHKWYSSGRFSGGQGLKGISQCLTLLQKSGEKEMEMLDENRSQSTRPEIRIRATHQIFLTPADLSLSDQGDAHGPEAEQRDYSHAPSHL